MFTRASAETRNENLPYIFKQSTMCTLCNKEPSKFPEDLIFSSNGKQVCITCCKKILPNHCRLCGLGKSNILDVQNINHNGATFPVCEKCVRLKNNNFTCQLCSITLNKKPYTIDQNMGQSTIIVCKKCFKKKCHNCTKKLFDKFERFKISTDTDKRIYCLDCYLLNILCGCNICTKLKSRQTVDLSTIDDNNICPYWRKKLGKMI